MLRLLLILFTLTIFTSVSVIYYQNPSLLKSVYAHKLVNPRTWGKVEIVEERPIGSLKVILKSEVLLQIFEQLFGFVAGILICVLVGWRFSFYHNIYDKTFENSLADCHRKQDMFEKQLGALELQIIDFERKYLFTQKDNTLSSESCSEQLNFPEESKQFSTDEIDETHYKENQKDSKSEGLVRRAVEVIMKQDDFNESNFDCILEKLTKILERLSKLSKEQILPVMGIDNEVVQEQEVEYDDNDIGEQCYEKKSIEVVYKLDEREETNESINIEIEGQNPTCPEAVDEKYLQYTDGSFESNPYELHPCESTEKIKDGMMSIAGAGESEETFRGKIVPVSQIPKYQDLRKQKVKMQKGSDSDRSYRNTPDQQSPERVTPQTTPRKKNSVSLEGSPARTMSRGGRRKQRS